jgi:NAD(P)-dependent dehydrogenase (short-subunit alcohol dehydrogenase family)
MANRLAGKVAIVTGAGSGIGRATALLFAAEGASVMCADIDEDGVRQWNRMIAINLTSVWLTAKYALPQLIRNGGGSIINQSSTAGLIGIPGIPHYSAAKTGVIGLTRQLAAEYGPQRVRCNAICPSSIPTPLVRSVWEKRALDAGLNTSFEQQETLAAAKIPLGRLGVVADCANLALFLASDESSWITGVAMPLDGGLTAT